MQRKSDGNRWLNNKDLNIIYKTIIKKGVLDGVWAFNKSCSYFWYF